jgi:hypothetical protein
VVLRHPVDLESWRRWQLSRQPATRRVRSAVDRALGRGGNGPAVLARSGPAPRVVVVLDARTPTALGALWRPITHLPPEDVAVRCHSGDADLAPADWKRSTGAAGELLSGVVGPGSVLLALGHYLGLGASAHTAAAASGARFITVQHGLMTPYAPPLAPGTTLLAWSSEDAEFWRSGRDDVTTQVVGSQLLWDSAEHRAADVARDSAPVFLGQLHGAELPRSVVAGAAEGFCLETGATYRPHPAEVDRRSRATHRRWEAVGITLDRSPTPLRELRRPVVGIFSTGVVEAAAAGMPAWVHLPDPPAWVEELWDRYGLAPWGGEPTPSPERPTVEPSRAVADAVRGMMGA